MSGGWMCPEQGELPHCQGCGAKTGAEPCEDDCPVTHPEGDYRGEGACNCETCQKKHEAAYEQSLSDFYGGSGAQSVQERYEQASRDGGAL